jgi:hypothetical protein
MGSMDNDNVIIIRSYVNEKIQSQSVNRMEI